MIPAAVSGGLLLLALALFAVAIWQRRRSKVRGPKGWPIIGHLPTVWSKGLPGAFEEWSKEYGPNYEIEMNGRRWVVLGSLSAIKQVGMSSRYVAKVTFSDVVLDKIFKCKGLGLLLNRDVHRWKVQRKLFVQSLTPNFINHVGRVAHTECPTLITAITSLRNKDGMCNIHELVKRLFARTIVPLALGFDEAATESLLGIPYIFQYFRYTPLWLADTVFRKRTDAYRAEVDNYRRIVEQIVLARKAHLDAGGKPPADFVSHLLRAHNGEVGDSPLSLDEVRYTAIEMFVGATNSTPDMVCYVVLFLAEHQDIQERVLKELASQPDDGPARPTPYLDMVIKETMRHALPSFGSLRDVTEDDVIEGIELRKGDAVCLEYRALHYDTEFWGPRPYDFQPELHTPEACDARPAHTYLPFGIGPKGCPGTQLAMTMMRVVLSSLIRSFHFETYNGLTFKRLKKVFHIAIKPGEPTNVICKPRA